MNHEHKALAGALIYAHADRDGEALLTALRGVRDHGDPTAVMLALAATAAELLIDLCGDDWREALSDALMDLARGEEGGDGAADLG